MVDTPISPAELEKLIKQQENHRRYFFQVEAIQGKVPEAWKTPEEKASSAPPVKSTSPECTHCKIRGCPSPSKCIEILRLRAILLHYADQCGVTEEEVRRVHNV